MMRTAVLILFLAEVKVEVEKNKQWLAICRKDIEKSLEWGACTEWSNEDFELLSEKIWGKTNVKLSLSTMKRIWGKVKYDNFPNSVTLNALAAFLGYSNWRDFCDHHPIAEIKSISDLAGEVAPITDRNRAIESRLKLFNRTNLLGIGIALATILAIVVIAMTKYSKKEKKQEVSSYYKFTSKKVTDNLPNSVVFTYAGTNETDSVMIQEDWDSTRLIKIDATGDQHTSVYYYPGYFLAKLFVNNRVVKESPVVIQTKGWKAIAGRKPLPVYFNDSDINQKGFMGISADQLKKALNVNDLNSKLIEFDNVREFPGINSRDFTFEVTLRNASTVEESLCRQIRVVILGTEDAIVLPLADAGCIAKLDLFTGDAPINGSDHDLSAFGCDFSRFQDLKCQVEDQILKIFLNDKMVFTAPERKTLGRIVGTKIFFEGAGQVQQVKLSSGKIAYNLVK
jgi:hypothetical protein